QQSIEDRNRRGTGRDCGAVNHLFTGLVQDPNGGHYSYRVQGNGYAYLVQKDQRSSHQHHLSIPYPTFEKVMLRWLVEVKIDLTEEETDVATLEAKAAYLDTQIHKIKAKIKEKALDSLFDVLASVDAAQRETQQP